MISKAYCKRRLGDETEKTDFFRFKNGKEIPENLPTKYSSDYGNFLATLTVHSSDEDDIGDYVCVAENDFGVSRSEASLNVIAEPRINVKPEEASRIVSRGEKVQMVAEIGGIPKPEVKWSKDGTEIVESDRVHITTPSDTISTLTVSNVTSADTGTYTVSAANDKGTMMESFTVQVKGKKKKNYE